MRWQAAVAAYQVHLTRFPGDGAAWLQMGHALKETGDRMAAEAAYTQATRLVSHGTAGWIELANLQRVAGRRAQAIDTLQAGLTATTSENGAHEMLLADALLALVGRDQLPLAVQQAIEESDGIYARSRYAAYRRAYQVRVLAPLEACVSRTVLSGATVVIDGVQARADLLALTIESLDGKPYKVITDWSAAIPVRPEEGSVLLITAGTRIVGATIPCLQAALDRTGAPLAYSDHDHWELMHDGAPKDRAEAHVRHFAPCLHPMYDPFWFMQEQHRPACCLVSAWFFQNFATWTEAFAAVPEHLHRAAHVPLLLASRFAPAISANPPQSSPVRGPSDATEPPAIQVVIQTRDAPGLLATCVRTLIETASRPHRLDIVIVDNRSVLPETADLLAKWSCRGVVRVIAHDEPFNWARANNLAVGQGSAPYLLFLNNDVAMRSVGWDEALTRYLGDNDRAGSVGVVGACLLYPDERIQHAGVVIGMTGVGPMHEGVGVAKDHHLAFDPPGDRWSDPRLAAAVTGAWMATTRGLFEAVGGFDERLPIAFNDIDFCLRSRAMDRTVLYAADIVAIHHESATRGATTSIAQVRREQMEWQWLRGIWGAAVLGDPAYNPHWTRVGQPCDGLVFPDREAVDAWTMASAHAQPWSVPQAK